MQHALTRLDRKKRQASRVQAGLAVVDRQFRLQREQFVAIDQRRIAGRREFELSRSLEQQPGSGPEEALARNAGERVAHPDVGTTPGLADQIGIGAAGGGKIGHHPICSMIAPDAITPAAIQRRTVMCSPRKVIASAVPNKTLVSRRAASCAVAP